MILVCWCTKNADILELLDKKTNLKKQYPLQQMAIIDII